MTNRTIWDSCKEWIVWRKISCYNLLLDFFSFKFSSTPGVSMIVSVSLLIVNYLLSRVKPAKLSTIANLSPTIQLNNVDLPQLGRPTIDTLNLVFYTS